jgi:hypothetical protein
MLDLLPENDFARATILSYNGLPLALIEAAELASRHAGLIVPIELVSLWPSLEAGFFSVAYVHPETKRRTDCDRVLNLGTAERFVAYEQWLTRVQRAGIDRVIQRRRWFPWAK